MMCKRKHASAVAGRFPTLFNRRRSSYFQQVIWLVLPILFA